MLSEATPTAFRDAVLDQMLQQARRKRVVRQARFAAGAVAASMAVGCLLWLRPAAEPPPGVHYTRTTAGNHETIRTRESPAETIITSRGSAAGRVITSAISQVAVVHTSADARLYRIVGDEELLALAGRPAALIRLGPQEQRLVFVDAAGDAPRDLR